jgi:hypothetical protein
MIADDADFHRLSVWHPDEFPIDRDYAQRDMGRDKLKEAQKGSRSEKLRLFL